MLETTRRLGARRVPYWALLLLLVIGFAWTRGTFDNFLWRVNLNYNSCIQNGFGAVFCGDAAERYQRNIGG